MAISGAGVVVADCPNRDGRERCDPYAPDLAGLFAETTD
jgi:hypothetical protein